MPPRKGTKKAAANSKKGAKTENYVQVQKEQSEHGSEAESDHEANALSESDEDIHCRPTRVLERELTYSDADREATKDSERNGHESAEEMDEAATSVPLPQKVRDMPALSSADESEPENQKALSQSENENSTYEEDEAPAATSAKDKAAKSAPNQMKASKTTKGANQKVESIFDSPEPAKSTRGKPKKDNKQPVRAGQSKSEAKSAKQMLNESVSGQSDEEDDGDEEEGQEEENEVPSTKKVAPKKQSKPSQKTARQLPKRGTKDQFDEEDQNADEDQEDEEPTTKKGATKKQPKQQQKMAKQMPKKGAKDQSDDENDENEEEEEEEEEEDDDEEPPNKKATGKKQSKPPQKAAKKLPKRGAEKQSNEEDENMDEEEENEERLTKKEATKKQSKAQQKPEKSMPKKGAQDQSDGEEEEEQENESPVKRGAARKQLKSTQKDNKENEPPKRVLKSGRTVQAPAKPDKARMKNAAKSKEKADNGMDHDDAAEKSLHLNPSARATVASKIHDAVILLADRNKRCSLKEVVTFLTEDIQLDVERHKEKIKTILKQMFSDKEIVPFRRGIKPGLNVVFKLGSKKKKPISVEKRKSIMMAEKKKKQNAKKSASTKATSKAKSKKTSVESDLEEYEDDEDVPPIHR